MSIRVGVIILVFCLIHAPTRAENAYFRRDFGIAEVASPPIQFDASQILWKLPLATGHSTPIVRGGHLFLTTFAAETKEHATVCIDRETGKIVWRQVAPTTFVEQQHAVGSPASASVAIDQQHVYAFFGGFGLLAYHLDGRPSWKKPLGPFQDEFGSSSSPIVFQGRVLLNEDHDTDNFLLCLEAASGELQWRADRNDFTRSYATPVIWQHDGQTEVLVAGALRLTSYDLETGTPLWWVRGLARIVNTTPVVQQDRVFVATWSPGGDSGERIAMESWQSAQQKLDKNQDQRITRDELQPGAVLTRFFRIDLNQDQGIDEVEWSRHAAVFASAQNQVLAIRPGGRGDLTDTAVLWKTPTGAPYVASPTVADGILYLAKDGGIFTSIDAVTGTVLKRGRLRGRGNYYSSPVAAGPYLYVASQKGVLSVLWRQAEWSTETTHDFGEGIYATPVFDRDRLYIRTETQLFCFRAGGTP